MHAETKYLPGTYSYKNPHTGLHVHVGHGARNTFNASMFPAINIVNKGESPKYEGRHKHHPAAEFKDKPKLGIQAQAPQLQHNHEHAPRLSGARKSMGAVERTKHNASGLDFFGTGDGFFADVNPYQPDTQAAAASSGSADAQKDGSLLNIHTKYGVRPKSLLFHDEAGHSDGRHRYHQNPAGIVPLVEREHAAGHKGGLIFTGFNNLDGLQKPLNTTGIDQISKSAQNMVFTFSEQKSSNITNKSGDVISQSQKSGGSNRSGGRSPYA